MYGAILGDIIGSKFEFDRGPWTKEFELFTDDCSFTDDTAMTIAIGDALLDVGKDASVAEIEQACVKSMRKWGCKYPDAGYGRSFRGWLKHKNPRPYGSYGNGSAMRVSAAGWLYDSLERTREVARATANVSHNHPEGIVTTENVQTTTEYETVTESETIVDDGSQKIAVGDEDDKSIIDKCKDWINNNLGIVIGAGAMFVAIIVLIIVIKIKHKKRKTEKKETDK